MRHLPEQLSAHARSLAELAGSVQFDAHHMGGLCRQLCESYRALGIAILLRDADVDAFFHWLIQSALTRKYFLAACISQGALDVAERKASRCGPFLDALAANQPGLARRIAVLSPTAHQPAAEYEDDFDYAHALHLFAAERPDETALRATLDRFEEVLEGARSSRLDVARALLARDQDAFDEAFPALLDLHDTEMGRIADSVHARDPTVEPNRRLFVEGLGLLRLAEARGLATAPEYRTCRALARARGSAPFKPLAFPMIPLED